MLGGGETDEGGHVFVIGIATAHQLACGTGFRAYVKAGHGALRTSAAGLGNGYHHAADGARGFRLNHLLALRRGALAQEAHRQKFAVAGEDGVAVCQLQQAHLQAVAERHGGLLVGPPVAPVSHQAGRFAGET